MAKRYIDADALLEKRWDVPFETNDAHYVQVVDVADIENAPTADVAEVVRCGECTKWDAHEGDEYGTCANGEYISRNDYCSLGERKTDNEQV